MQLQILASSHARDLQTVSGHAVGVDARCVDATISDDALFSDLMAYHGKIDSFDAGDSVKLKTPKDGFVLFPQDIDDRSFGEPEIKRMAAYNGGFPISAADEPLKLKFFGKSRDSGIEATHVISKTKKIPGLLIQFPDTFTPRQVSSALLVLKHRLDILSRNSLAYGCNGVHFEQHVPLKSVLDKLEKMGWVITKKIPKPERPEYYVDIAAFDAGLGRSIKVTVPYEQISAKKTLVNSVLLTFPKSATMEDQRFFENQLRIAGDQAATPTKDFSVVTHDAWSESSQFPGAPEGESYAARAFDRVTDVLYKILHADNHIKVS